MAQLCSIGWLKGSEILCLRNVFRAYCAAPDLQDLCHVELVLQSAKIVALKRYEIDVEMCCFGHRGCIELSMLIPFGAVEATPVHFTGAGRCGQSSRRGSAPGSELCGLAPHACPCFFCGAIGAVRSHTSSDGGRLPVSPACVTRSPGGQAKCLILKDLGRCVGEFDSLHRHQTAKGPGFQPGPFCLSRASAARGQRSSSSRARPPSRAALRAASSVRSVAATFIAFG